MPGKKKGKGEKKADGLPPPPNLDQTRQGALEALLKFRINDREDAIEQFEEESENYKGKNVQLREKGDHLQVEKARYYKSLVKQAKEHDEHLDKSPKVEKGSVEQALAEKIELARWQKEYLRRCEERIAEVGKELEVVSVELKEWTTFRDVVKGKNSAKIALIKETMKNMLEEEAALEKEYQIKQAEAKTVIEGKTGVLAEKEKQAVSERFLSNMDKTTRGELSDNAWLKQEIAKAKQSMAKLASTVSSLEHRNIKAIEMVTAERTLDIENTRSIYLATNRKRIMPAAADAEEGGQRQAGDSGLPSLVNIAKCTSEKGPGGQAGQFEMKLLSLHGSKAPVIQPPETFHLPPLDQQMNSEKSIPSRSTWPVTSTMLKSIQ